MIYFYYFDSRKNGSVAPGDLLINLVSPNIYYKQGEDTGATPPASLMMLCLASHLPYDYFSSSVFESLEERLPYEVFASFLPPPLF